MNKVIVFFVLSTLSLSLIINASNNQFDKCCFWGEEGVASIHSDFDLVSKAQPLEAYLPKNFSRKGDVDYTRYLQEGLNNSTVSLMPNFPVLINHNGLKIPSNSKILFQKESKLIMKPNNKLGYQAILIENVTNVEIYDANLVGDRMLHKGKDGEWGMGILIRNGENVRILRPRVSNFWGDGIYIGGSDFAFSNNITIEGGIIDNNRRNGISIVSAKDVFIRNINISNTNGTNPEFGIDIEPNNSTNIIENIKIDSVYTIGNKVGVGIVLDRLIGRKNKNVTIDISRLINLNARAGVEFFLDRGYSSFSNNNLRGTISIINLKTKNKSSSLILNKSRPISNLNIFVSDIAVDNVSRKTKYNLNELSSISDAVHTGRHVEVK